MSDRVSSNKLLEAGLQAMKSAGCELKKKQASGRALIYEMENGETVRVRTCNDHVLLIGAGKSDNYSKLGIEGTDQLLVVMPEVERTPGNIIAYLIPTKVAVDQARKALNEWESIGSRTKGSHITWYLFFSGDKEKMAHGYHKKWEQYRLRNAGVVSAQPPVVSSKELSVSPLKQEIDEARARIAKVAGVSVDAVRITIDFGA